MVVEVNFTVYLITIRLQIIKKLHKAAIANTSVCDVGDEMRWGEVPLLVLLQESYFHSRYRPCQLIVCKYR